ncbi:Protein Star [Armadillidium nasatum]|uniref:Protein Star n=1 Tax=Armadillidium nasatum TaxID=96803 RepID=A0A5N5SM12_9CRUS|nr:Protein Star [Armadillidium nasatum]
MHPLRLYLSIFFSVGVVVCILLYKSDLQKLHPILRISHPSYAFYPPDAELNSLKLKADDPKVIKVLERNYLFPPSRKPYNLSFDEINPSMGQAQKIDRILNGMNGGFFIECGALDGETRSNTLYFERERHWKGLLIEADPKNFDLVLSKNRKAYSSPTCLAPDVHPISVKFQQQKNMGHIVGENFRNDGGTDMGEILEVQCFPLLSYLKALNVTTVDYFSLDVEGAEFSILQSIPWKEVNIKTLSVEYIHDKVDKFSIVEYMRGQGYVFHSEVTHALWLANDFIFVKSDLYNYVE